MDFKNVNFEKIISNLIEIYAEQENLTINNISIAKKEDFYGQED